MKLLLVLGLACMAKFGRLLITVHLQKFFNKSQTPWSSRVRRWVSGLRPVSLGAWACRCRWLVRRLLSWVSLQDGFPGWVWFAFLLSEVSGGGRRLVCILYMSAPASVRDSYRIPARSAVPAPGAYSSPWSLKSDAQVLRGFARGAAEVVRKACGQRQRDGPLPAASVTLAVKEDVCGHWVQRPWCARVWP